MRVMCLTHSSMLCASSIPLHSTPAASPPVSSSQLLVTVSSCRAWAGLLVLGGIPSHASREAFWACSLLGWPPLIMWDLDKLLGVTSWGKGETLGVGPGEVGRWCVVTEISLDPCGLMETPVQVF